MSFDNQIRIPMALLQSNADTSSTGMKNTMKRLKLCMKKKDSPGFCRAVKDITEFKLRNDAASSLLEHFKSIKFNYENIKQNRNNIPAEVQYSIDLLNLIATEGKSHEIKKFMKENKRLFGSSSNRVDLPHDILVYLGKELMTPMDKYLSVKTAADTFEMTIESLLPLTASDAELYEFVRAQIEQPKVPPPQPAYQPPVNIPQYQSMPYAGITDYPQQPGYPMPPAPDNVQLFYPPPQ